MLGIFLCFSGVLALALGQQGDVCSQVFLMSQYCSSQGGNRTTGVQGASSLAALEDKLDARFIELEARLVRGFGESPEVNYTALEETITKRFKGVEARVIRKLGSPPKVNYTVIDLNIEERFKELETQVNGDDNGNGIVDYHRIERAIDERFTEVRAYIDAKFATLVNDTEEYGKAVAGMKRRRGITDCSEIRLEDAKICNATGGVFDIHRGRKKYEVYCDTLTDHGGWTVFQRRVDGSENFNRTYEEYVNGFGNPAGEFWLGLKNVHELLHDGTHELRVDLMDKSGSVRFAKYGVFYVAGKSRHYELAVTSFTGDSGDSLSGHHRRGFSTFDHERDSHNWANCAIEKGRWGGWWFSNCGPSSLNGIYGKAETFYWNGFANLVKSEMKFRKLIED